MAAVSSFQTFNHGHQDLVLALHYNLYSTRLVTASSDQELRVFEKKGENWELLDHWRAHDAEIVDVKWNGPFSGQHIGSIGEDGYFKLWEEDINFPPNSKKRFRSIMSPLRSKTALPHMCLDFKNYDTETYLALITRDGNLSIMEPKDHDNLMDDWRDWMESQDLWVCDPPPERGLEPGFRLAWHQEKMPCWDAVAAGLDRRALSLVVAAMDVVKVYRTDKDRRLYLAAQLEGSTNIVRDVAWANGSMRGYDIIATAGKDGTVRIYELRTPVAVDGSGRPKNATLEKSRTNQSRAIASGISTGLAGNSSNPEMEGPGRVFHEVKLVGELREHRSSVWRVVFSFMGDVLISTGDDGGVRTWKRGVDLLWHEYAEIDVKQRDWNV